MRVSGESDIIWHNAVRFFPQHKENVDRECVSNTWADTETESLPIALLLTFDLSVVEDNRKEIHLQESI